METDWELSQAFVSDGQGVRCACVLPSKDEANAYRLVMGTQGGTLWEFQVPSGLMNPIAYQHNHSITAILSRGCGGGGDVYVTGCKDSVIRVFDSGSHELQCELKGHEKAVTSLAWAGNDYIISGSWDGTAKIWHLPTRAMVATLPGHENTVTVCGVGEEKGVLKVATGSAGIAQGNQIRGHTTRLWTVAPATGQVTMLKSVANDHEGPIRDLSLWTPDEETLLATCSNDGTVRLRSLGTAESVATYTALTQDPPILLSLAAADSALFASAEDGNVFMWDTAGTMQSIAHASCVWRVLALPENDIATCCQDGTLRIFTQATDRYAPEAEREAFSKEVQAQLEKKRTGPSQDEISKLPQWSMNSLQQGKSEGQVQVFQKDGKAIAAQWSAASQTWIEVGEVVGNAGESGMVDGQKYDFVFPIEVDTQGGGVAKLQIGYNTGENPFVAAQRFLDAHQLPQHHLSEIADYIQQRAGSNAHPTLGGGAATAPATAPVQMFKQLPIKSYKAFELTKATNFDKLLGKLEGVSDEQRTNVVKPLTETLAATNRYHAATVTSEQKQFVLGILKTAKPHEAFPALDLARLMVLLPSTAGDVSYWKQVFAAALHQCSLLPSTEDEKANIAVPMLTLRLLANAFRENKKAVDMEEVLKCTQQHLASKNKLIRSSVASLLWNAAFYLKSSAPEQADRFGPLIVGQVHDIIEMQTVYESEAATRALMALGTVLLVGKASKEKGQALFLVSKVERFASPHGDAAKATAKDIYSIVST